MEQLSIARALKPQGLKGELKCKPLIEKVELFSNLKTIFCSGKEHNIISSIYRLGFVYICLENVESIEEAEKFRGKIFYIDKEDFGELEDDTYFIEDLIGLTVYTENGDKIGEVLGVENYGATDILQVKDAWATYLVPFVEKVFPIVDMENKKIIANKEQYEDNKVWK